VQARYQSWETSYPLDSARALIAQMRNVRFAQPGVWLQTGIETSGRLIGDVAVRVDGDQARQATAGFILAADAQGHGYVIEALRTVISLLFTEHDVHRICTRHQRSSHWAVCSGWPGAGDGGDGTAWTLIGRLLA
jgi:aminoglycoside 6'-N-acetyltransferase